MKNLMQNYIKSFSKDKPLKILILEDSEVDFMLISIALTELELPYIQQRAENKEEFTAALRFNKPDIVLSDYNLPSLNGLEALELKKLFCPDIPFIFITGYLGEERAVETMKQGATDFVLKENLGPLVQLITRSLQEYEERRRRENSEVALRKSEAKYRQLIEQAADGIFVCNDKWQYIDVNSRGCKLLGYTREEMLLMELKDVIPDGVDIPLADIQKLNPGEVIQYETVRKRKDGFVLPVEISVSKTSEGYYQGIVRDISLRKKALRALEEAHAKLDFHIKNSPLAVFEIDRNLLITRWSGQAEKIFGWKEEEVLGRSIEELNLPHAEDVEKVALVFRQSLEAGVAQYQYPIRCNGKNGSVIFCEGYNSISYNENGEFVSQLCILNDITVKKIEVEARREWRDQERKRIAREIHEGIGQMLVASKFKAASIDVTRPDAEERVQQVESLLEMALEEVRRISSSIAPRSVEELGIENALRQLCQQVENTAGVKVSFFYSGEGKAVANNLLSTVYRITKEAMDNAIKHAFTSEIQVELNRKKEVIELKVKDNGRGFAVDKTNLLKTNGLRSVKERVSLLGGEIYITSNCLDGTLISVILPVEKREEAPLSED